MISAVQDATCTVVISRGQSRNPQKRGLEQGIADEIGKLKGVNVLTIPHLYDLPKTSDSYQQLSQIEGDLIVVSWIYSRAAHWILDRNGIQGQVGHVEIGNADDDDSEQEGIEQSNSAVTDPDAESADPVVDRVTDLYPRPDRKVHCIDLKVENDPQAFITEIKRILGVDDSSADTSLPIVGGQLVQVEEQTSRRCIQLSISAAARTAWSASTFACLVFTELMGPRIFSSSNPTTVERAVPPAVVSAPQMLSFSRSIRLRRLLALKPKVMKASRLIYPSCLVHQTRMKIRLRPPRGNVMNSFCWRAVTRLESMNSSRKGRQILVLHRRTGWIV